MLGKPLPAFPKKLLSNICKVLWSTPITPTPNRGFRFPESEKPRLLVQYRGGGAIGSFRTGISIHKNFTLFDIGIAKFIFLIRGKKKRQERKVKFRSNP